MTPIYGLFVVFLFGGAILVADFAFDRGFEQRHERVTPDRQGEVRISVQDLGEDEVRFFRFLNAGNQEVKFFVGRDRDETLHVAFDASDICNKKGRGFRAEAGDEGGWMICNFCDKSFRLTEINSGRGGCAPVPLDHRVDGDWLILSEADILKGWRLFN